MAQVFMAEAGYGPSIGQSEIALGAFQHLDMRLFVYRQDHRALWGIEVQAHDVGRLRGELGIGADAPTAPALQLNPVAVQNAPDVMARDVAQGARQKSRGPGGMPGRRLLVQCGQHPAL
jgi:hypothetical protein